MLSSFPRSFSATVCGACDGVGAGPPGEVGDDDVVNFIALVTFSSSSRVCSCSRSCVGCKKGLLFTVTVSLLATLSFIDDDAISFLLCVCVVGGGGGGRDKNHARNDARAWVCVVIFFLAQLLFFFLMRDALELFVFTQPGWMDGAGRPVAPPPLEKREKRKKNFFTVRRTKRLARARNEQIAYNLTLSGIITT